MESNTTLTPIEISLSFVISDNYSQHLAVVLASVLKNAGPNETFVFHVLASYISEENQSRLRQFEQDDPRCRIVFHQVDKTAFEKFPLPIEHVSVEMYYRYLLPELLTDESRTIYSDVDVLVYQSLRELWETPLTEEMPLAAVQDVKEHDEDFRAYKVALGMKSDAKYFYSGLLVMDLAQLRKEKFAERCMENTNRYIEIISWPDQDVINLTMEGRILELPLRLNCTVPKLLPKGEQMTIEHFASYSSKPWCCLWKNTTWPKYLKYLLMTPYRDNAWAFVWSHIKGFFYFRYTKKGVDRILICGLRVWRQK